MVAFSDKAEVAHRAQLSALHVLRSNRPSNSGFAEIKVALATARKMYEDRMMKSTEKYFELWYLAMNSGLKEQRPKRVTE
jgi:hypothetical protein